MSTAMCRRGHLFPKKISKKTSRKLATKLAADQGRSDEP
jgi:hypothetical protein